MNKLPTAHLLKNPLVSAVLLGACALGIGTMCLRFVLGRLDGQGTRHVPRSLESKLENHEPQSEPQMPRSTQTPNGPAPALRVIAAYALSTGRSLTRPIISGGKFWIGSSSGTLEGHSISPTKNEKKWTLRKTLPISEAPLLIPSRSIMLVTETPSTITATSRLTALQSQPPKILWEREFDGLVAISADEKSNTFFAATDVFGLWAFRLTDGSPLWQSLPPGRPAAGILVSNDTVYIPSSRQTTQSGSKARRYETTLHALSANFGNIRWSIRLPGAPWGTPIEDPFNRDVLLTTQTQERGWAHAIEASSGKLRWTWELPARPVKKSVTIASAGVVVHALESGEVIALRLSGRQGSLAWSTDLKSVVAQPISASEGGWVAVITTEGKIHIIDAKTGSRVQALPPDARHSAAPYFAGDEAWISANGSLLRYVGIPVPKIMHPAFSIPSSSSLSSSTPEAEEDNPEDEELPEQGD